MEQPQKTFLERHAIRFAVAATVVVIAAVGIPALLYALTFGASLSSNQSDWAAFGSFYGGFVGPMVALLAVIGQVTVLAYVIRGQRQVQSQLELDRRRMKIELTRRMRTVMPMFVAAHRSSKAIVRDGVVSFFLENAGPGVSRGFNQISGVVGQEYFPPDCDNLNPGTPALHPIGSCPVGGYVCVHAEKASEKASFEVQDVDANSWMVIISWKSADLPNFDVGMVMTGWSDWELDEG